MLELRLRRTMVQKSTLAKYEQEFMDPCTTLKNILVDETLMDDDIR